MFPFQLTPSQDLFEIQAQIFFNKVSKVTKIDDNSAIAGVLWGCAKVGQKSLKDIYLSMAHLFPDTAYEQILDKVADNFGIAPRFAAAGSSTYVRVVGDPGTQYLQGVQTFQSTSGQVFDLVEDVTISDVGFNYAKIRSQDTGQRTNSVALSINTVTPVPVGHEFVVNEYQADGGYDNEIDDLFRKRIKEGPNILARNTIAYIEQAFLKTNDDILRVFYQGINDDGQVVLAIATQNGVDLTQNELDDLLVTTEGFLAITDQKPFGNQAPGVFLQNIEYQPIDISFRVDLFPSFNPDDVRKDIQVQFSKYLDYRNWEAGRKVEWDDLLEIVKNTRGVKYVPDNFFFPNEDVIIDDNKLPRIRGFLMLDLNGGVISDVQGILSPIFYPLQADFSFIATVLQTL